MTLNTFNTVFMLISIAAAVIAIPAGVWGYVASRKSQSLKGASTAAFTIMITFLAAFAVVLGAWLVCLIQGGSTTFRGIGAVLAFGNSAVCWAIAWKVFASHEGSDAQA